jgi:hypothetical protein
MNDIKTKKIKEQKKLMTLILLVAAALCLVLSFIINATELKLTLLIVATALFGGLFIARLFKGSFGYKPTLEEMEERQFAKK